jgi:hypothetical protein
VAPSEEVQGFFVANPANAISFESQPNPQNARAQGRFVATSLLFLLPRALPSQTGASRPLSSPNRCTGHIHGRYHLPSFKTSNEKLCKRYRACRFSPVAP